MNLFEGGTTNIETIEIPAHLGCRTCIPGDIKAPDRLRLLRKSGLLDGEHPELDRLASLCSTLLNVPVVLVSFVDVDRQVFPGQIGLPSPWRENGETPLSHSFCQYVVTDGKPLLISDARQDDRLHQNKAIEELDVIAYAGYPIITHGQVLGSFCAIRPEPHHWSETELSSLKLFSEAISDQIELRLENEEMKVTQSNLWQANAELENIAQILAHDLKAPLRGIRGFLHLFEDVVGEISEEAAELLSHIDGSASRMSELIDALSEFSDAIFSEDTCNEINMDLLFESVKTDLNDELSTSKALLVKDNDLGTVFGLKPLVGQLLQNLISNALKFQPKGQSPEVRLGRRESDGAFYVTDNGLGIQAKDLERIFDLYRKGVQESDFGGMGLGLAICARVVSKHNGAIWVDSEVGKGSTFFFTLRLKPNDKLSKNQRNDN